VRKLCHKRAYKFCLKHNRVVGITNTRAVRNFEAGCTGVWQVNALGFCTTGNSAAVWVC